MIPTPLKHNERIFGLDLLRAFAILLVVFGHSSFILNDTFLEGFPFIKMIDGVDFFFVLSGFLIGTILLKKLEENRGKFSLRDLLEFWKRRWFRTLPAYYLVLILNLIFAYFHFNLGNIEQFGWKFIFFLQNFHAPFYDFFWESWSLSIEEWFYVFCPVLIFGLRYFFKAKSAFLLASCVLLVLPLGIRFYEVDFVLDDFWYGVSFRKVVLLRLDVIAYGLIASWIAFYYPKIWFRSKCVLLAFGCVLIYFLIYENSTVNSYFKQVYYFSLCPLSVFCLLPFLSGFKLERNFFNKIVTYISKISYSMYLINLGLLAEVFQKNVVFEGALDRILNYLLYWIALILFSSLLYYFFETPTTRLRDKF